MKMLKHALAGITEGRADRGVPVEVMGLMIGKPQGTTLVVTDVFPLPVKGIEYEVQVMEKAMVFMTQLQDALELRRNDRFVGWYHSHPFDLESYSHCHLSATDVGTQMAWQFSSPWWLAIVVDPLRSLFKQAPELGAYRCYPATHNVPNGLAPDGSIYEDENSMLRRWGAASSRYYELPISYFSSSVSAKLLTAMTRSSLWAKIVTSAPSRDVEAVTAGAALMKKAIVGVASASHGGYKGAKASSSSSSTSSSSRGSRSDTQDGKPSVSTGDVHTASSQVCAHAVEQCCGQTSQLLKAIMFNFARKEQELTEKAMALAKADEEEAAHTASTTTSTSGTTTAASQGSTGM